MTDMSDIARLIDRLIDVTKDLKRELERISSGQKTSKVI